MEPNDSSPCLLLLRGINVGGNSTLPMSTLKECLENVGAKKVQTYLNSGNAVFSISGPDRDSLATALPEELLNRCGFSPRLLLIDRARLLQAIEANPFPDASKDGSSLHLGFLEKFPPAPDLNKLTELCSPSEKWQLNGQTFYLYAPEGVGRSRLAAGAEKALGVMLTDRNWRTVTKLFELMDEYVNHH